MTKPQWQFIPESGSLKAKGVIEASSACKRHLQSRMCDLGSGVMRGVGPGDDGRVWEESQAIYDLVQ